MYGYVMQDSDTTHTEKFSMVGLEEVFGERLMRSVASRYASVRLLYVGDTEKFCAKNPYSFQELKVIFKEKLLIFPDKIFVLCREIFFYGANPAQKMEVVSASGLFKKYEYLNS
jgi:hypothetical protein